MDNRKVDVPIYGGYDRVAQETGGSGQDTGNPGFDIQYFHLSTDSIATLRNLLGYIRIPIYISGGYSSSGLTAVYKQMPYMLAKEFDLPPFEDPYIMTVVAPGSVDADGSVITFNTLYEYIDFQVSPSDSIHEILDAARITEEEYNAALDSLGK